MNGKQGYDACLHQGGHPLVICLWLRALSYRANFRDLYAKLHSDNYSSDMFIHIPGLSQSSLYWLGALFGRPEPGILLGVTI